MSTAPSIIGFQITSSPPDINGSMTVATLVIEHGPWLISGLRLCRGLGGNFFFKAPQTRAFSGRVVLRPSSERDALLIQAVNTLRQMAHNIAASPLATAPESTEPSE